MILEIALIVSVHANGPHTKCSTCISIKVDVLIHNKQLTMGFNMVRHL